MLIRALAPLLLLAVLASEGVRAEGGLPADLKDFDFKPVTPKKDPATGFVVGGENATALIGGLTHLNGRTIVELEADMRTGTQGGAERTQAGFLGPDERLLDVMAEDNRYVVEELGLTHQALARPMLVMGFAGGSTTEPRTLRYHGRRFRVTVTVYRGVQMSPFRDKTASYEDALVENIETGKFLEYSLLAPRMVERYGFYGGKGTRPRVEPRMIVEVFDFLRRPNTSAPPDTSEPDKMAAPTAEAPDRRPSNLWLVGVCLIGAGLALLAWLWLILRRANAAAS